MARRKETAQPAPAQADAPHAEASLVTVHIWPLKRLVPDARNARTHSKEQIEQLTASIGEWGWTSPILADASAKGLIVAGHGRRLAAQKIYKAKRRIKLPDGRELPIGTVPVIDCSGWSEEQRRAYMLADNRLPLNAGWDNDLLAEELQSLEEAGADLDLLGFSDKELDRLLPPDEDDGSTPPPELKLESGFHIMIACADEAEQLRILERLQKDGIKCRALIA